VPKYDFRTYVQSWEDSTSSARDLWRRGMWQGLWKELLKCERICAMMHMCPSRRVEHGRGKGERRHDPQLESMPVSQDFPVSGGRLRSLWLASDYVGTDPGMIRVPNLAARRYCP